MAFEFDFAFLKEIAPTLFGIGSPTGYTDQVRDYVAGICKQLGYSTTYTGKGNLLVTLEGQDNSKTVATSAHMDTLGLMVRSIQGNGTLLVTKLGGPIMPTLDAEYCTVVTREGKKYTGTILSQSPSSHVYKDAETRSRLVEDMLIRLDEVVHSEADVRKLGIEHGDIVLVDTKFTLTPSGFLKSRFVDDKASVLVLLTVLKWLKDHHQKPKYRTLVYFVSYEEVGHGAASVDSSIQEFVTVDMGCVGLDLAGNEYAVSVAAKDSGGPYDYELTSRLIHLAQINKINYVVDIFPFYGSDVGAAWRAGGDFKGALIGPGVHASHGMERTHLQAIDHTMQLLLHYLLDSSH